MLILLLIIFTNLDQHVAQAANLICFIPAAIVSIILNLKQKNINLKNAIFLAIFGIIGSIIGAIISQKMDVVTLRKFFGIFLLFICIHEIISYYVLYIKDKNKA